jgi:hypothetical protein
MINIYKRKSEEEFIRWPPTTFSALIEVTYSRERIAEKYKIKISWNILVMGFQYRRQEKHEQRGFRAVLIEMMDRRPYLTRKRARIMKITYFF